MCMSHAVGHNGIGAPAFSEARDLLLKAGVALLGGLVRYFLYLCVAELDAAVFGGDDRADLLDRFFQMPLAIDDAVIVPFLLGQFVAGIFQAAGERCLGFAPAGGQSPGEFAE